MNRFACRLLAPLAVLACMAAPPAQAQTPAQDGWTFAVTPYLWLPNVNGDLAFDPPAGGGGPEIELGPNDWLEALNGALLIAGEARHGRWAVLADFIYLDFEDEAGLVKSVEFDGGPLGRVPVSAQANLDTRTSLRGAQAMLAGAHRVLDAPRIWLDAYAGLRYFTVKASVDWRLSAAVSAPSGGASFAASGNLTQREDLWDGIVGLRGRARVGEGRWFLPFALDVGTGESRFTWQAMAGAGYAFDWGDVLLSYRHLSYDMDDGKLLQNLRFSGFAMAATFRF